MQFLPARRQLAGGKLAVVVCLSVRPSVASRCSTETAKRRITQTTPHESPGIPVFWYRKSWQNWNGVTRTEASNTDGVGYSWKLATFDAKHYQLRSVASLSHWAFTCTFATMQRVARVCQRQLHYDIRLNIIHVVVSTGATDFLQRLVEFVCYVSSGTLNSSRWFIYYYRMVNNSLHHRLQAFICIWPIT